MCLTKEQHELHVRTMIDNLAHDEKAYDMDNSLEFRDACDVCGPLLGELVNTEESLKSLRYEINKFFEFIRYNESQENKLKKLQIISLEASQAIGRAVALKAVALKAIEQLGVVSDGKNSTNNQP